MNRNYLTKLTIFFLASLKNTNTSLFLFENEYISSYIASSLNYNNHTQIAQTKIARIRSFELKGYFERCAFGYENINLVRYDRPVHVLKI
jgi:hypothetical protein